MYLGSSGQGTKVWTMYLSSQRQVILSSRWLIKLRLSHQERWKHSQLRYHSPCVEKFSRPLILHILTNLQNWFDEQYASVCCLYWEKKIWFWISLVCPYQNSNPFTYIKNFKLLNVYVSIPEYLILQLKRCYFINEYIYNKL